MNKLAYTNSKLISYTKISPMKDKGRKHSKYNPTGAIKKITIHHMAGNLSVETCGRVFQNAEASANYGIGSDGRIALYVDEKDRSWASSSAANDYLAVTIEVANSTGSPNWKVSDAAYKSLIKLCVDICKRNKIEELEYTGNKNGNLTMHQFFAATACPGPYLKSKFPQIAKEVNAQLKGASGSLYRVRKTWKDASSQKGAFKDLNNAKECADKNKGYFVFDSNGNKIYPKTEEKPTVKPKKVIEEDGAWGTSTTRYTQKFFKTYADGIVSGQLKSCRKYLPGAHSSSWVFKTWGSGSPMITALQKYIGTKADGKAGYNTVVALQKFLDKQGLYSGSIDGIMGYGTVLGWQKFINKKFR